MQRSIKSTVQIKYALPLIRQDRLKTLPSKPSIIISKSLSSKSPSILDKRSIKEKVNEILKKRKIPIELNKNVAQKHIGDIQLNNKDISISPHQKKFWGLMMNNLEEKQQIKEPIQNPTKNPNLCPYSQVQQFYDNEVYNKSPNQTIISSFIQLLQHHNPLFRRMNIVLTSSLFRLGFITVYEQSEIIHKRNVKIKNIGFILWGEARLKKYKTKEKLHCLVGQTFGEEIIFQNFTFGSLTQNHILNDEFYTKQICKASTSCGILYVGLVELRYICQQLISRGFRQKWIRFTSLLQRIYIKKKQFRRQQY